MTTLDLTADIIDVRDIIERVEELESLQEAGEYTETPDCELQQLQSILSELAGYGGDEQWRGDWYPITLIRNDYFVEYVIDLAKDVGDVPQNLPSYLEIDWEASANNVQQDYSFVNVGENTYWYR